MWQSISLQAMVSDMESSVGILGCWALENCRNLRWKKINTWTTWIPQIADLLTKKETFSKSKQFVLLLKADCYSQQNAEFGSPSQRWYRPRLPQCPCSPKCKIDQYGMRLECDRQQLYYFYWSSKSPLKKCWGTQFRPIPIPCSAKTPPGLACLATSCPLGPRQRETRE